MLRRRAPSRQPRKRILIVCEGEVTERRYFHDLKQHARNPLVEVEISRRTGDPLQVVQHADERNRAARADARRERDDNLLFDQVWAVFDVDEHTRLDAAKHLAAANGIELAVSNPCFELWALLHFQDQASHIERRPLADTLRRHLPDYDKLLDFGKMHLTYADAVRRATRLDAQADAHGEPGRNPTTGVYRLTAVILSG